MHHGNCSSDQRRAGRGRAEPRTVKRGGGGSGDDDDDDKGVH